MKILVSTLNTPLFNHEELRLTESWSEVDLAAASPATRDALELYTGTHIQVHPDHVEKFEASKAKTKKPKS